MSFFSKVHERTIRKFIVNGVDFVLIGGHAAVYYGVRRTTSDIDILVRPTIENGIRIVRAFKELRLDIQDIQPDDFTTEQLFTFGMEPDAVDLLNFSRGVALEEVFANAKLARIDKLSLKIIGIHDLLKNKEGLHRTGEKNLVDQQDILALKRIINSR
jgi:hypothetical protein